jgi:hypothetical protein
MDSNKTALIIFGLLLAAFLAVPLLKPAGGGAAGSAPSPNADGTRGVAAPVSTGPNLTQADLMGSVWKAESSRGPITVELRGDGSFVATPESTITAQMLRSMTGQSQIVGNWQVSGTSVNLSAQVGPQAVKFSGQIQGQGMMVDGQPATRVR